MSIQPKNEATGRTVARFEKVSEGQFAAAAADALGLGQADAEKAYAGVALPRRATSGSAGYDFFAPIGFTLAPGETVKVPTAIRAEIDPDWALFLFPRSGLGFRYRLQLDNTVGIVDSDYYGSDNEGHILVKITNDTRANKTLTVRAGEAFCQGVFLPYGLAAGDEATARRNGGFGSTTKK